jgi:hypothetical protein
VYCFLGELIVFLCIGLLCFLSSISGWRCGFTLFAFTSCTPHKTNVDMAQLNNHEGWQSCTSNHKNCSPVNFESHLIKVRATIIGFRHFATWRRSPWVGWALVSLLWHLSSTACLLDVVSFPNLNLVPSIIQQSSDSRPIRISWVTYKCPLNLSCLQMVWRTLWVWSRGEFQWPTQVTDQKLKRG